MIVNFKKQQENVAPVSSISKRTGAPVSSFSKRIGSTDRSDILRTALAGIICINSIGRAGVCSMNTTFYYKLLQG
jgi:hypothetical protein